MNGNEAAAGPRGGAAEAGGTLLATTFYVREGLCALDAALVEEVVRLPRTTPVPHAPDYLLGIMNLRGNILSVIDLGRRLDLGLAEPGEASRVYIVRDGGELMGLLVDRAADVVELEQSTFEPPPANVRGVERKFLQAIGRTGTRLVAVLDSEAVLAHEGE